MNVPVSSSVTICQETPVETREAGVVMLETGSRFEGPRGGLLRFEHSPPRLSRPADPTAACTRCSPIPMVSPDEASSR